MKHLKRMNDEEGDMGIGTMILFIAMVLVAAVAAALLISTAGDLNQQAQETGRLAQQEISSGFQVVEAFGLDSESAAEVTTVTVTTSSFTLTDWDTQWFTIYDASGPIDISFDSTGSVSRPGSATSARWIEVDTNGDASVDDIATSIESALPSNIAISVSRTGAELTITDSSTGYRTDATTSDPSLISVSTTTQGVGATAQVTEITFTGVPQDGDYFTIYNTDGAVDVWFTDGTTTSNPGSAGVDIEIDVSTPPADAPATALLVDDAFDGASVSLTSEDDDDDSDYGTDVVSITDSNSGARDNAVEGQDTGGVFSLSTVTEGYDGEDDDIDDLYLKVRLNAGSQKVDMSNVIIEVTGDDFERSLEFADWEDEATDDEEASSTTFCVEKPEDPYASGVIKDPDGLYAEGTGAGDDSPIVSQGTLLLVHIDVAAIDTAGGAYDLTPQEEVTVKIIPKHGTPNVEVINIPEALVGSYIRLK